MSINSSMNSPNNSNFIFNSEENICNFTKELLRQKKEKSQILTSYKLLQKDAIELKCAFKNNLNLISEKEKENLDLTNKLNIFVCKNKNLEQNLNEQVDKIKTKNDVIVELKSKIENLEKAVEKEIEFRDKFSFNTNQEKLKFEQKLQKSYDEKIDKIEQNYNTKIDRLETNFKRQSESDCEKFKNEIEVLNKENQNLNKQLIDYNLIQQNEQNLISKISSYQNDIKTLEEAHLIEISQFQTVIENSEEILDTVEEKLAEVVEKMNLKIKKLQAENDEKLACMKSETNNLQQQNNNLEQKITNLINQNNSLQLQANNTQNLQNSLNSSKMKIKNLIFKNENLLKNSAKFEEKSKNLTLQNENLTQKCQKFSTNISTLEATICQMQNVMVKVGVLNTDNKIDKSLNIFENLNNLNRQKCQQILNLEQDLKQAEIDKNKQNLRYSDLEKQILAKDDEISNLKSLIGRLRLDVKNLENDISKNISKENDTMRIVKGLNLNSDKGNLVMKLSKAISTIENLSNENNRLTELNNRVNKRHEKTSQPKYGQILKEESQNSNFKKLQKLGSEMMRNNLNIPYSISEKSQSVASSFDTNKINDLWTPLNG